MADGQVPLPLLHGPAWVYGPPQAHEEAGGVLAAPVSERQYWRGRDTLACSEEVQQVAQPWWEAGRTELTTRAVQGCLNAYGTALMDTLG
ncbi:MULTISPECIES: aminoglycoside phosphotransferase [Streptomyces]|uniref:aminoglycoside phosphotransferase n=1 Tax=Streptomyces TaxID=1883 RepID=UPI000CF2409C|nr:aminoglycoside phosphotransferase [Streptomyces sp. 46]PPS70178.1 aminoglycoside phosphotransferase [Streptomyces sp. 46]